MSSNPNRLWIVATALVSVVVIALGGLLGVAPQFAAISAADEARAAVELSNQATQAQIVALKAQSEDLSSVEDELADAAKGVPSDMAIQELTTAIYAAAAQTSQSVKTLTAGDGAYYAPVAASASDLTRDPVVAADPTAGGLVTPANFITVPIELTVQSTTAQFVLFVARLQTMDRLFLITELRVNVAEGLIETSMTGFVYVLIDPSAPVTAPADDDGEEGTEPTPTPTPTDTPTLTPTPTETSTATP